SVGFVGGAAAGSQTLYAQVFDIAARTWSSQSSFTAATVPPASVSGNSFAVVESGSVAIASDLTVSNLAGDSVVYRFYDGGGVGHFTLNGTAEAALSWFNVSGSNLGS